MSQREVVVCDDPTALQQVLERVKVYRNNFSCA
jgi:hypothetical protein